MSECTEDEEKGTVRITVSSIDDLEDNVLVYGPTQTISGLPWRLGVRMRPRSKDRSKVLGAFVSCNWDVNHSAWACDAEFSLRFVQNHPTAQVYEKECQHEFARNQYDWGYSEFIKWRDMQSRGLIQGRSISLEADIKVNWAYNREEKKKTFNNFRQADAISSGILLIEEQQIHLLALNSPFFKALFYSDFKERNQVEIPLPDVTADDFVEMLQVLYPPHKPISDLNVETVLKLADRYGMEILIEKCEDYLSLSYTLPRIKKLVLADSFNLKALLSSLMRTLKSTDDVKHLREKPEFEELSADTKIAILDKGMKFAKN